MKDISEIQVYQTAVKRDASYSKEGDLIIRMALHPMGIVNGLGNGRTKEQQYPFRVVYRNVGKRGKPWFYSCLGVDVRTSYSQGRESPIYGDTVGDGSDAAALLWLLEEE